MQRVLSIALCLGFVFATGASAQTDAPLGAETSFHWRRRPSGEDFLRYYPENALHHAKSGSATITCKLSSSGNAHDCTLVRESPPGWGFGDAAVRMGRLYKYPA